ncbi:hypothetical protein KR074_000800 [Drosophila pseudoananassae]|nr:hypothetical protein KR074_000800 [Drosophila pseudoananassae]
MAAAWSWRSSHSQITMTNGSLALLLMCLLFLLQPPLQVAARRQLANSQELLRDYDGSGNRSGKSSSSTASPGIESEPTPAKQTVSDADDENSDDDDHTSDLPGSPKKPTWRNPKKMSALYTGPSGSMVSLNCDAFGNPKPNITWYRNGTSEWTRSYHSVKRKRYSLTMGDLVPDDSGNYTCKVCNVMGCIRFETQVLVTNRVNHKPILTLPPSNLTLLVNSSGEMECNYLSDLTSTKAWIFIQCQAMTNCSKNRTVMGLGQDKLTFVNVTEEQEGWYWCVNTNSLGRTNASAYLRVVRSLHQFEAGFASVTDRTSHMYFIGFGGIIFVLMVFLFFFYAVRKMKHEKLLKQRIETVHQWTKKVIIFKPEGGGDSSGSMDTMIMPVVRIQKQRTTVLQSGNEPAPFNEYEFPLDSNWELPRSQLVLGATLGEGAFGRVVMAEVNNAIVAVKMVKEGHTDDDIASLVREMEVMKIIGRHINIINLLGCCSQNGPLYVIVEYAPYGNLKDFLFNNRPFGREQDRDSSQAPPSPPAHVITEKDLIKFAHQIARGMDYLASRRCIHRDLAARNVLVTDDYVLKIADFGLARDIQSTDYYRKNTNGRLPIKWMAPESLQEKFYDSKSDVWSYGILLWEIMTYGAQPYPTINAEELYGYLVSGQRMEKPAKCSMNIYILMRQCWHFNADDRPPFTEIVEYMDKLLQAKEDYLDVDIANLDTPPSTSDEEEDEPDNMQKWYN